VTALEAARTFASSNGLPSDQLSVLRDGSNLIVHLRPAPVVLRIATLTARIRLDPLPWLAREVELLSYLAGIGAPAMAPSDLVAPGPHVVDGWAMSAWSYVEHEPPGTPDARTALAALDELHAAMRGYPAALPVLNPAADDLDRTLRFAVGAGLLTPGAATALTARRDGLLAELLDLAPDRQPLHGDAFARNAVQSGSGVIWLDFEDCCSGPVIWDLAVLARRDPDPEVVAEIERRHGPAALRVATELRAVQAEPWTLIHGARLERGW
jgi:streptomycin 6-kinase